MTDARSSVKTYVLKSDLRRAANAYESRQNLATVSDMKWFNRPAYVGIVLFMQWE